MWGKKTLTGKEKKCIRAPVFRGVRHDSGRGMAKQSVFRWQGCTERENIGRDQDKMQPWRSHQWHFLPLRPSPTICHLPIMPTLTPSGDELIYLLGQSLKIQLPQAMPSPACTEWAFSALSYSSQLIKKLTLLFEFRVSVHRSRDSSISSGCCSSHPHSW